jgi:hypothetical protein
VIFIVDPFWQMTVADRDGIMPERGSPDKRASAGVA